MMDGFSFADFGAYRPGATGLAATGTTQADAVPLHAALNRFETVPAGSGCMLPQVSASNALEITVLNRGNANLAVYPPTGGQIEALAINAPFTVQPQQGALFQCFDPAMTPGRHWSAVLQLGVASAGPYLPLIGGTLAAPGNLTANGSVIVGTNLNVSGATLLHSATATTPAPGDSSQNVATTAFVQSALGAGAGAVPGGAVIAATPPAGLNPGALWWDSTGGQLYVRYDDGNTQQFVVATNVSGGASAADVAMAQNNVGRNKLHNGLFTVAQRGGGAFTTNGAFTADRWAMTFSGGTTSVSLFAISDGSRTAIGDEAATTQMTIVVTGTAGAADYSRISQCIEGVQRLAGKTVIVSFYALATTQPLKIGVNLYQSFGTGGSPSAGVFATAQAVTTSAAWTRYNVTIAVPSAIGKILGTAPNTDFTQLLLYLSAGANNNSVAGSIGVQSGSFTFWGVQLEIAAPGQTQPSPLEKLDPRMELSNCQRFYQVGFAGWYGSGVAGNQIGGAINFPVAMRAAPTIAFQSPGYANSSGVTAALTGSYSSLITANATAAGQAAFTAGYTASADL